MMGRTNITTVQEKERDIRRSKEVALEMEAKRASAGAVVGAVLGAGYVWFDKRRGLYP